MSTEYILENKDFLISETDEKGNIAFANKDFCKASGYELKELIGKPHSIVRSPDMPRETFQDLWDTVQAGKVWKGYVKNSTKNGGYYWVYATVFPMPSGYISCRIKPSRSEIKAVEELYKTMNKPRD